MRSYHLPALLLSATAHLGAGFVVAASTGLQGGATPAGAASSKAVLISLKTADQATVKPRSPVATSELPARLQEQAMEAHAAPLQPPASTPAVAIQAPPQPHYFRVSELTEKPHVVQDIASNLVLVTPDIPSQAAVLRLFINDEGSIDKVEIEESRLPAQAQRRIVDAFSGIRFQPGKIGRLSVRSQLRIQISLQDALAS